MPKGPTLSSGKSWFKHFQYEEGRDSPTDARNVILVVVTLIATMTFQAGVNPPGGVWQDDDGGGVPSRTIFQLYSSTESSADLRLEEYQSNI
ncbi:hypothetical protein Pint_00064 [Pistacia integerrima]|uniref:Uncharacterized protein n=1 Tax=Pistacia integerrima TaxID=434235 RepID=A0ACC0ZLE2_9ROSI|nr:hypothetical protein Pint_00064 [Pistacia integerrima]